MNAEFVGKMLKAKRLEAEAVAALVPPEARRAAACAVRALSEAALDVLESPGGRPRDAGRGCVARPIDIG
ncbi:hypothetical protein [Arabiibacter massiliensis]|uniref:hypothetical protein n=1 Tax=Arabiibacter massiliensis TaxID=1870985 RepID=UPI0009BB9C82|nr:hypothetical protein [Arabiibacter massiliensis]